MIGHRLLTSRLIIGLVLGSILSLVPLTLIPEVHQARAVAVAVFCLVLWLGEATPPFVPSLLLLAAVPLAMSGPGTMPGQGYSLGTVLGWMADPVLVLFLGGMTLGVAAQRHGIDASIASLAVRWSGGRRVRLIGLVMIATASLSMWMSNTAAAAMMLAALRPIFGILERDDRFRAALLLGIAMAANLGGMATPIGSPPNAIAVAALEHTQEISLLSWMLFGLPCTAVLLLVGFIIIRLLCRWHDEAPLKATASLVPIKGGHAWSVIAIFVMMVLGWLLEPWHGISVPVIAAIGAAILFGSGLLTGGDLGRIDWSTLILIAGGLALGHLLQQSGSIAAVANAVDWSSIPEPLRLTVVMILAALLSAVMSNTATATMLIPLAFAIDPSPATPILVALACSLGMPFAISTPPNALVYGEGLQARDLLISGLIILVIGYAVLMMAAPLL